MNERLTNQKDSLARLMATENLTIVHRKVPTAYFDLKNRLLCCPILKEDISSELYDLFMGHEVSHALHTPFEGVHSAVTKNRTLKGYLNVVEDVRIERFIKDKYPGLRKSFFKAYNELMEMDFFGVKGRDLNKECSLIDKINLITKCGSRVNITLSKEEQFFLDWSMKCQTWEEVEECATAIYEWSKENETRTEVDEKLVPQMFDTGDEEEGEEDFEDYEENEGEESFNDSYSDSEEEEEDNLPEVEQETTGSGEEESDEGEEETENEKPTGSIASKGNPAEASDFDDKDGARESITEHNAHNNEEMFISDSNYTKYQVELGERFKEANYFKDYVTSYKELNKLFESFHEDKNDYGSEYKEASLGRAKWTAKKIEQKNKAVVMHMAKEFEMRQTAQRAVHSFSGKTGKLDMNRLAKYQIVDDVFKRVTYMPDGKNHGVNILVDWSGSICGEVMDILEQAYILTMFCRKVNIPHRVYLFSDAYRRDTEREWRSDNSTLIELFSSEMTGREYKKAVVWFSSIYNEYLYEKLGYTWGRGWEKKIQKYDEWYRGYQKPYFKDDGYGNHMGGYIDIPREYLPTQMQLGGTPLDQALVASRTLLKDFIKNYGIEKSILTVITDGYSHSARSLEKKDDEYESEREQRGDADRWDTKHVREIIDPYSRRVYPLQEAERYSGGSSFKITQNLLHWLSKETGTVITGYFVCGKKNEAVQVIREAELVHYETDTDEAWRQARKGGFVMDSHGYNKLFITAASNLGVEGSDELDDELVDAKKTKVLAAFKKNQKSKTTSRVLTNEFIKEIA